nr:TRIC cation channel family protein [Rhodococcus wratislaviensis]GLK41112.1 membrane protein [Rhodococcus wratislaviensis]
MATEPPLLFVLDLVGTFAFALNGALTAVRAVRLDIVGVVTLGMITALGGGAVRDFLLDALPPATFVDLRYLAVAAAGALIAFGLSFRLERLAMPINVLDAIGLSVFAVLGAHKALELGFGVVQAVIVGTITGVGGGTIRDVLIGRIPTVLRSELYAIPAVTGAAGIAAAHSVGHDNLVTALGAAAVCFVIRMLGVRFDLHAPRPPGHRRPDRPDDPTGDR